MFLFLLKVNERNYHKFFCLSKKINSMAKLKKKVRLDRVILLLAVGLFLGGGVPLNLYGNLPEFPLLWYHPSHYSRFENMV